MLAGRRKTGQPLAGKSTLNRLELGAAIPNRYKRIELATEAIDALLVDLFFEAHRRPPAQMVFDLDASDLPLHGHQKQCFFRANYNGYCYLPLYIFSGEHLLCARVRAANPDAAGGVLMAWCEANKVEFVLGLARNSYLERKLSPAMEQARVR